MPRPALLALALLVPLVGCLGGGPASPASPMGSFSPSPTTTGTLSPTATPYPNRTVGLPSGQKERPERPSSLTTETAAEYAIAFAYRYSYNAHWTGPGTEIGFSEASCSVESNESVDDGHLVTAWCSGYVNLPSNESTVTVHSDLPPWTVRYYIDENSVLREEL